MPARDMALNRVIHGFAPVDSLQRTSKYVQLRGLVEGRWAHNPKAE